MPIRQIEFQTSAMTGTGQRESVGEGLAKVLLGGMQFASKMGEMKQQLSEEEDKELSQHYASVFAAKKAEQSDYMTSPEYQNMDFGKKEEVLRGFKSDLSKMADMLPYIKFKPLALGYVDGYDDKINTAFVQNIDDKTTKESQALLSDLGSIDGMSDVDFEVANVRLGSINEGKSIIGKDNISIDSVLSKKVDFSINALQAQAIDENYDPQNDFSKYSAFFGNGFKYYGNRVDGTLKDKGWLGEVKLANGQTATELSVGVEIDGKAMLIPSLVPTLSSEEKQYIIDGGDVRENESIMNKAIAFAKEQVSQGKSPFYETPTTVKNKDHKNRLLAQIQRNIDESNRIKSAIEEKKNKDAEDEAARLYIVTLKKYKDENYIPDSPEEITKNMQELTQYAALAGFRGTTLGTSQNNVIDSGMGQFSRLIASETVKRTLLGDTVNYEVLEDPEKEAYKYQLNNAIINSMKNKDFNSLGNIIKNSGSVPDAFSKGVILGIRNAKNSSEVLDNVNLIASLGKTNRAAYSILTGDKSLSSIIDYVTYRSAVTGGKLDDIDAERIRDIASVTPDQSKVDGNLVAESIKGVKYTTVDEKKEIEGRAKAMLAYGFSTKEVGDMMKEYQKASVFESNNIKVSLAPSWLNADRADRFTDTIYNAMQKSSYVNKSSGLEMIGSGENVKLFINQKVGKIMLGEFSKDDVIKLTMNTDRKSLTAAQKERKAKFDAIIEQRKKLQTYGADYWKYDNEGNNRFVPEELNKGMTLTGTVKTSYDRIIKNDREGAVSGFYSDGGKAAGFAGVNLSGVKKMVGGKWVLADNNVDITSDDIAKNRVDFSGASYTLPTTGKTYKLKDYLNIGAYGTQKDYVVAQEKMSAEIWNDHHNSMLNKFKKAYPSATWDKKTADFVTSIAWNLGGGDKIVNGAVMRLAASKTPNDTDVASVMSAVNSKKSQTSPERVINTTLVKRRANELNELFGYNYVSNVELTQIVAADGKPVVGQARYVVKSKDGKVLVDKTVNSGSSSPISPVIIRAK